MAQSIVDTAKDYLGSLSHLALKTGQLNRWRGGLLAFQEQGYSFLTEDSAALFVSIVLNLPDATFD